MNRLRDRASASTGAERQSQRERISRQAIVKTTGTLPRFVQEAVARGTSFGTPAEGEVALAEAMVERVQSGEVPVFLLSLKAGGTGLNLTEASHVVLYDRWWNPAVEDQATDRAYRIGQHGNVLVHTLVSTGTLDRRSFQPANGETHFTCQRPSVSQSPVFGPHA